MKRIAIITGASSGIGKEFAKQLAHNPKIDELWLLARRDSLLQTLSKEITEATKKTVHSYSIDLSGEKGVKLFLDFLEQVKSMYAHEGFSIEALVNNAGFGTYGTFVDTPLDRQLTMIDLNVYSLTALCAYSIPYMPKDSTIYNVASLAAYSPLGNFAVYAATKAYVLSFSIALAAELKDQGIFVSSLCPGPVDTEFSKVASNGARTKVVDGRSPERVVAKCLKDAKKGKYISIMAFKWKFKAFASRFVGRFFFARYTYLYEKRPSQ